MSVTVTGTLKISTLSTSPSRMPISFTVDPSFGNSSPLNLTTCVSAGIPVLAVMAALMSSDVSDGLTSTSCVFPSGVSTETFIDFGSKSNSEPASIP